MSWVDVVFVFIVLAGLGYGIWTGLVMQISNVVGLVMGALVAGWFSDALGRWMGSWGSWLGEHPWVANGIAYTVLFVATVVVVKLFGLLARKAVKKAKYGGWDRALGGTAGFVGGLAVCVAITMMCVPPRGQEPEGVAKHSYFMPKVMRAVEWSEFMVSREKLESIRRFLAALRERAESKAVEAVRTVQEKLKEGEAKGSKGEGERQAGAKERPSGD